MNGDQQNPTNQNPAQSQGTPGVSQKPAVVEKLKSGTSILVAVNANPTIDQLASAIALTLILEKLQKNATAVFSGKVPSALEFLKPKERFQKNTDSLRDFIIAIDKSKADKLRYKVEDNVVKIFITPYKSSITEKDLQYNAGDFNVDVIVALGVQHQQDLDTAITTHGRIFHDAVVVSISNVVGGDFGIAHWEDQGASSLSELIAQMAVELGQNIIDADIATALLTGIVAETGRFSNAKTHPATMSISSILLQAGADQQLVNQQLQSVISGEIKLQAGAEIKPTMSAEQLAEAFPQKDEELVIGADGVLMSADEKSGEDKPKEDKPETESLHAKDNEQENSDSHPMAEDTTPSPEVDLPEPSLPEPTLAELESKAETETETEPATAAPAKDPADDPDEAEAARKAVTDALKNAAAEAEIIPAIAAATPQAQPGPGPAAPAPAAENTVPPIGSEPAPLAGSPADQALTMPLPPAGAFSQAPPVNMTPTAPAPGSTPPPPPLPPPVMPSGH